VQLQETEMRATEVRQPDFACLNSILLLMTFPSPRFLVLGGLGATNPGDSVSAG
jgi:hypothetical protein